MKRLILPLLIAFLLIGGCSDDSDVEERLAALEAENAILKAAAQTGTPDTTTNTPTPTPTAIAHTQTTPTPTPPPRTEPAQSPTATPRIQPTPSPTVTLRTQSTPTPAATPIVWTVIKIIDGDTVDVRSTAGDEERVRVVGIDTPERGECGFTEASTALSKIALNKQVTLVAGARDDRDRYNRILRYLDVGSIDAGLKLIEAGFAIARYDSRDGYGRHIREDVYVATDAATKHFCDVDKAKPQPTAKPTTKPTVKPTAKPTTKPTVKPTAKPSLPIGERTGLPLLYDPKGADRNCGDFKTWAQAQDFFEASGGPGSDPHKLDSNKDGNACESLPGAS
tara:strand:- start:243 stop:1253 length:1011 start_codon:yes stop_codon:yes gene_type:complete